MLVTATYIGPNDIWEVAIPRRQRRPRISERRLVRLVAGSDCTAPISRVATAQSVHIQDDEDANVLEAAEQAVERSEHPPPRILAARTRWQQRIGGNQRGRQGEAHGVEPIALQKG